MSQRMMSEVDSDLHILEQRLKGHVEKGMQGVLDIAENISECCKDDEALKKTARDMMLEFIEMEIEIQHQATALKHLKQMKDETNPIQCLDERLAALTAHNSVDPKSHPNYQAMETKMEADNDMIADEEFETLRATLLGSTEEEDVALTQTEVNIKCPYSGRTMVNPVRNTVCGHVYDKEPILEHVKARRGRAHCPVGGCTNPVINVKKLVEHTDMKKYIDYVNQRKTSSSR